MKSAKTCWNLPIFKDGKVKPVMVRLHQKKGKNGEFIFIASADPRESAREKEYVRLANNPGCAVFIDENKVATLGLEEGTTSTLFEIHSKNITTLAKITF